ncbi:MAG: hypothetical protein WC867_01955 [Candidatus Pacearchaeota archaeon]|jgi:hypothetical protein
MTKDFSRVLLVANERQEGHLRDLAEIMSRHGVTFDIATGREDAISHIKKGNYEVVYLPDALDLGSQRKPSQEDYDLLGPRTRVGSYHRTAAMFECVRIAKDKGLTVVVDEGLKEFNTQLTNLGVVLSNSFTNDSYSEFKLLNELLKKYS